MTTAPTSDLAYEDTINWLVGQVGSDVTVSLGGQEAGIVGVFSGVVERGVDFGPSLGTGEDLMFKLSGDGKTFSLPREQFVRATLTGDVLVALLSGGFLVIVIPSAGLGATPEALEAALAALSGGQVPEA